MTHHSGQTGTEFEKNLPLLRFLIEDVQPGSAFERAEPAEVGERCEVEVLGLGHGEAPDEEVEEAGVVHVYGVVCRVAGVGQRRMSRCRRAVSPPLRPGGTGPTRAPPGPAPPAPLPPGPLRPPPAAPPRTQGGVAGKTTVFLFARLRLLIGMIPIIQIPPDRSY